MTPIDHSFALVFPLSSSSSSSIRRRQFPCQLVFFVREVGAVDTLDWPIRLLLHHGAHRGANVVNIIDDDDSYEDEDEEAEIS